HGALERIIAEDEYIKECERRRQEEAQKREDEGGERNWRAHLAQVSRLRRERSPQQYAITSASAANRRRQREDDDDNEPVPLMDRRAPQPYSMSGNEISRFGAAGRFDSAGNFYTPLNLATEHI